MVLLAQRLRAKQNRLQLIHLNLVRRLGREQQDCFLRRWNERKLDNLLQRQARVFGRRCNARCRDVFLKLFRLNR